MYSLQNRRQDSSWRNLNNEIFEFKKEAKKRAKKLSKEQIFYGMVRVIGVDDKIIATYTCGERCHV